MCGGSDKPKQSAEERELGRIAVERWNDYQVRYRPVENEYMEDVRMTDSDYSQIRGNAASSVQQSFGRAQEDLTDNLFAQGVNPSGDSFVNAVDSLNKDMGLSMGTGLNEAEHAVSNAHIQGLQNVVAMGQGQAASSIDGFGDMAANATRDAIGRSERAFGERQAGLHLVGTVGGAAAYGNLMNDKKGP